YSYEHPELCGNSQCCWYAEWSDSHLHVCDTSSQWHSDLDMHDLILDTGHLQSNCDCYCGDRYRFSLCYNNRPCRRLYSIRCIERCELQHWIVNNRCSDPDEYSELCWHRQCCWCWFWSDYHMHQRHARGQRYGHLNMHHLIVDSWPAQCHLDCDSRYWHCFSLSNDNSPRGRLYGFCRIV